MGAADRPAYPRLAAGGAGGVSDIVVEVDHQSRAGRLGEQALDLRVIKGAYGIVVLEVREGARRAEQGKALGRGAKARRPAVGRGGW